MILILYILLYCHFQLTILPGIAFWTGLRSLRFLHLHDNPLGKYENLQNLATCPNLLALTMFDTPLCLKRNYRHHVVNSIWSLKVGYKFDFQFNDRMFTEFTRVRIEISLNLCKFEKHTKIFPIIWSRNLDICFTWCIRFKKMLDNYENKVEFGIIGNKFPKWSHVSYVMDNFFYNTSWVKKTQCRFYKLLNLILILIFKSFADTWPSISILFIKICRFYGFRVNILSYQHVKFCWLC